MLLHPEQTLNSSGQQIGLMTGTFSTICSYSQALDSYQQHEVRFNFATPRKAAKFLFRHLQHCNNRIWFFKISKSYAVFESGVYGTGLPPGKLKTQLKLVRCIVIDFYTSCIAVVLLQCFHRIWHFEPLSWSLNQKCTLFATF